MRIKEVFVYFCKLRLKILLIELLFNISVEDIFLMNFKMNNCIVYLVCIWFCVL